MYIHVITNIAAVVIFDRIINFNNKGIPKNYVLQINKIYTRNNENL